MSDTAKTVISPNEENNKKRKKFIRVPRTTAAALLFSMLGIIIALTAALITVVLKRDKPEEKPEPAAEPYVPVVNTRTYDFYSKDDILMIDDYGYGTIWLPAFPNVPKCTYDYSGLNFEDNRYTYSVGGEVVSKTGIDVSYHQGDIDWKRVAADGIDFVILRVGYRGYESGLLNIDARFHEYIKDAAAAGLDIGVYFYSQAKNSDEAIAEANFVMEQIRGYNITYPVIYDYELVEEETSRTKDMKPYEITECAAAFCDTVRDGGYRPMIYSSRRFSLLKMNMSKLGSYDFWFAEYRAEQTEPSYPYAFQIWQYASDGRVDGISGDVDLNICFEDYANPGTEQAQTMNEAEP